MRRGRTWIGWTLAMTLSLACWAAPAAAMRPGAPTGGEVTRSERAAALEAPDWLWQAWTWLSALFGADNGYINP